MIMMIIDDDMMIIIWRIHKCPTCYNRVFFFNEHTGKEKKHKNSMSSLRSIKLVISNQYQYVSLNIAPSHVFSFV